MFLICGEALFDVLHDATALAERPGYPVDLTAMPGGSPFNVAVGLSRLSRRVGLLTGIANDWWGHQLQSTLVAERVDTRFLAAIDNASTTLAMIRLDPQGVPQYDFRCFRSADSLLDLGHLPVLDEDIRAIHVGSFSLVTQPTSDTLEALVKHASTDRLVTLDPNVRLNVEPSRERWRQRIDTFRRYAHLIKISEEDIDILYQTTPESLASTWLSQPVCEMVIVTCGSNGAYAYTKRHGTLHVPAPSIDLVDTVGAGDAFQAALLCWLDEHDFVALERLRELTAAEVRSMLEFATLSSALTCSRRGPDFPVRQELLPR